jgi:hypothetical protein
VARLCRFFEPGKPAAGRPPQFGSVGGITVAKKKATKKKAAKKGTKKKGAKKAKKKTTKKKM